MGSLVAWPLPSASSQQLVGALLPRWGADRSSVSQRTEEGGAIWILHLNLGPRIQPVWPNSIPAFRKDAHHHQHLPSRERRAQQTRRESIQHKQGIRVGVSLSGDIVLVFLSPRRSFFLHAVHDQRPSTHRPNARNSLWASSKREQSSAADRQRSIGQDRQQSRGETTSRSISEDRAWASPGRERDGEETAGGRYLATSHSAPSATGRQGRPLPQCTRIAVLRLAAPG